MSTAGSLADAGVRLAKEVSEWLAPFTSPGARRPLATLSFVGHSLGCLITRAALASREVGQPQTLVDCCITSPLTSVNRGYFLGLTITVPAELASPSWFKCCCHTCDDRLSEECTQLLRLAAAQFHSFPNLVAAGARRPLCPPCLTTTPPPPHAFPNTTHARRPRTCCPTCTPSSPCAAPTSAHCTAATGCWRRGRASCAHSPAVRALPNFVRHTPHRVNCVLVFVFDSLYDGFPLVMWCATVHRPTSYW